MHAILVYRHADVTEGLRYRVCASCLLHETLCHADIHITYALLHFSSTFLLQPATIIECIHHYCLTTPAITAQNYCYGSATLLTIKLGMCINMFNRKPKSWRSLELSGPTYQRYIVAERCASSTARGGTQR